MSVAICDRLLQEMAPTTVLPNGVLVIQWTTIMANSSQNAQYQKTSLQFTSTIVNYTQVTLSLNENPGEACRNFQILILYFKFLHSRGLKKML